MNLEEAQKIANDFNSYLESGDDNTVKKYNIKELRMAIHKLPNDYRNKTWYKAMEDRIEDIKSSKFSVKNYIEYSFTIISILLAIIFGMQKQELVENKNQVNNYTKIIQQNNYYQQLPLEIREQIDNIAAATSDTLVMAK